MSNQMDPWLAQIYGTGGGEDLEKTAQYHLLAKLAQDEGIDLDGLSEEEIAQLAADVGGQEEPQYDENEVEQQAQQVLLQKEAEAKFEEADFLGRVMAHAYTNEMQKIASVGGAAKELGRETGKALKHHGSKAVSAVRRGGRRFGQLLAGGEKRTFGGSHGGPGAVRPGNRASGFASSANRGEAFKSLAARAGAGAAAGAGAYGATKEASAFRKLAEIRANEMLEAAGGGEGEAQGQPQAQVQPQQQQSEGQLAQRIQQMRGQQAPAQPQNQQQFPSQQGQPQGGEVGGDEQFDDLVNQRALEILAQNGYDPNEIVQALGQQ